VFLVNSRYPRFAATLVGYVREGLHPRRPTLSRSYGGNLQSSFTRVLSSALVFSTYPPESVSGTGTGTAPPAAFLGSVGSTSSPAAEALDPHHVSGITHLSFDRADDPYSLEPTNPKVGSPTLLRPCWLLRQTGSAGILTCLPSPTPLGLGLGSD
jgi:hypothetical protein